MCRGLSTCVLSLDATLRVVTVGSFPSSVMGDLWPLAQVYKFKHVVHAEYTFRAMLCILYVWGVCMLACWINGHTNTIGQTLVIWLFLFRPWSPGITVVMWRCPWLTSSCRWCWTWRMRDWPHPSSSTTRPPSCTPNTTTYTVSSTHHWTMVTVVGILMKGGNALVCKVCEESRPYFICLSVQIMPNNVVILGLLS